jgi:hypothetical protein
MTTLCKKLDLCANDAPTCLRPKCLTLVVVMKLATYVLQISSPSLFVPYYWIKRDGMMCLHRNVSSSSMVKLTLGNFFFLCHNTTDIRIKLIIKGTWKNGVIININCGIYINAKVVPIQYTKKVSSSTLHNQLRGKNYKSGKMLDCCCCISMALVEQLYNDQQQLCIDQLMNMKYGGII